MLDIALHLAIAWLEGAELDARQPQARHGLHVIHQYLGRCFRAAVFQYALQLLQKLGVFGGGGVIEGFLHLKQDRRAMFAIVVDRTRAGGIDHQQSAFG